MVNRDTYLKNSHKIASDGDGTTHLAILGFSVGSGHELQQGQQESDAQSQAQEEEEALQVMSV